MTIAQRLRRQRITTITAWILFISFAGAIPIFAVGLFVGTEAVFDHFVKYYAWFLVFFLLWVVVYGSRTHIKCPYCNEVVTPIGNQPYEDISGCDSCGKPFDEDSLDF